MKIYISLLVFLLTYNLFGSSSEEFRLSCTRFYDRIEKKQDVDPQDNIFFHLDLMFSSLTRGKRKSISERLDESMGPFRYKFYRNATAKKCATLETWLESATDLDFSVTSGNIPQRISSLSPLSIATHLKKVVLSRQALAGNSLEPLMGFGLEELDVSHNSLSLDSFKRLPYRENLRSLNISFNRDLQEVPRLPKSLQTLHAQGCEIKDVFNLLNFNDLKELTYIDLSENRIRDFPRFIFGLPALAEVNLSKNEISHIDLFGAEELTVNLSHNYLEQEPLKYTPHPNHVVVLHNPLTNPREEIPNDEIKNVPRSIDGVNRALNFTSIDSIRLYAIELANNGDAEELKALFYRFKGNHHTIFKPRKEAVHNVVRNVIEKVGSEESKKYLDILKAICEFSEITKIAKIDLSLLEYAATNSPAAFKVLLYYIDDIEFLGTFKGSIIHEPSKSDLERASNRIKPTDFLDRQDPFIEYLIEESKSVTDPKAEKLFASVCNYIGHTQREVRACKVEIASLRDEIRTGQSSRVFLTRAEEIELEGDETGNTREFYVQLQGRIINYFYVAALITTGAINGTHQTSLTTSATGFAIKTLEFFSKVIPIFGTIADAVSIPFKMVNIYSNREDIERAKSNYMVRASIGSPNILEHLAISKRYSLSLTHQLVSEAKIRDPEKDANLAFQFFQGNMLLFGFARKNWSEPDLVRRIAQKTVSDIIEYRKNPSWKERFNDRSIEFIKEGFEFANREDISRMLDIVAGLVASSQAKGS